MWDCTGIFYVILGTAYPVSGCHDDPVTGLPVAIELGSTMIDPTTNQPVPIVGVTIDRITGTVIPVGGTTDDEGQPPVLLYDSFEDPLARRQMKVTSARLESIDDWLVERLSGGNRALIDVNELYHESRLVDALRDFKEALTGSNQSSGRHEESIVEVSSKDLGKSRARAKTQFLRDILDLQRREERATVLSENGGSPGMYENRATGQLLPILVGTTMRDTSGSDLEVPILGVERDKESGNLIPLGGSVEDPQGEGLVPIMIGEKAIDIVSGQASHVVAAKYNHELGITEPITSLAVSRQRKKKPAAQLVCTFYD